MLDEKDLQRLEELVSRQISIVVENQIKPQLRLLAEGTADIQERLIPRARVDELEDEVRFLKLMVRQMAERVSLLEKAQTEKPEAVPRTSASALANRLDRLKYDY